MMYWDGSCLKEAKSPKEGVLLCEGFDEKIQSMANEINSKLTDPCGKGYNFKLYTHPQKGL